MSGQSHLAGEPAGSRLTLRRGTVLGVALAAVSAVVAVAGPAYLWPLFLFPLVAATVFFFELGGLVVTGWLGLFFVNLFAFGASPTPAAVRQAVIGTALFGLAGLLLLRAGLKTVFPAGLLFDGVRYGLIGLWAGFLVPWLFGWAWPTGSGGR